jgi:hypothetical protein
VKNEFTLYYMVILSATKTERDQEGCDGLYLDRIEKVSPYNIAKRKIEEFRNSGEEMLNPYTDYELGDFENWLQQEDK